MADSGGLISWAGSRILGQEGLNGQSRLVRAIQLAAVSDWQPYLGDMDTYALAQLRHVLRRGRALGLIASHEEMEKAA